jgi:hypothetical protein
MAEKWSVLLFIYNIKNSSDLVESHDLLENRRMELRQTKPYPMDLSPYN